MKSKLLKVELVQKFVINGQVNGVKEYNAIDGNGCRARAYCREKQNRKSENGNGNENKMEVKIAFGGIMEIEMGEAIGCEC